MLGLRSALRRMRHPPLRVYTHPAFRVPVASAETRLGFDPRRSDHVATWLLDRRVIRDADVVEAPLADWDALARVHTAEWLDLIDDVAVVADVMSVDPAFLAVGPIVEMWRRAAGAASAAAAFVIEQRARAAVLFGGLHHAGPAHGAGFCGLADVPIAIRDVRLRGFDGPITVLDLDAHPPDGLAACLLPSDRTRVVSVGVASSWEAGPGVVDLRVAQGATDETYLTAVDAALAQLGEPGLVFVLAGADPLAGDRFGGLACTEDGLAERDRRVADALADTPYVLLPAGGYTGGAWRVFATSVALAAGSSERPRADYDPTLRRNRRIARALDPATLGTPPDDVTDLDLAEALGMPVREPRLLGRYTRQGLEYALTRYGVLDALARMGFTGLEVEVRTAEQPHLLRVVAALSDRREVLIELALRHTIESGLSVIFMDWLTLRDPRLPFSPQRPALPGQEVPGLGVSRDVVALLVEAANRFGLDGVAMVPSHYHVAWMARHQFEFLDPDARGRFRALTGRLKRTPLHVASALLDGAGVPTELGEPIRWEPSPMLLAVSDAARLRLQEGEPRARTIAEETSSSWLPG